MEKILVTGVNGFVGEHLAKEFADNGYKVVGVGGPHGSSEQSPFMSEYHSMNLMDASAVQQLDFTAFAGVLHLAGLAAVGPSFDNPRLYIETNPGIELNLFEAAQAQGAKPKFVIVSSGSLYDAMASLPITEQSPVLPNSPYAVSKLTQEQLAHYYTTRGFDVVIARPFNHIGPGQNLGFIVPDLTKQAVDFENVEVDRITVGNLDAKRDYTDVRDIVCAYRLLFEQGKTGETYNICSGTSRSGHEILGTILGTVNAHPAIVQDPAKMRPSDTPDIYGSHEKLTADTGWQPSIDLQTTIQDVVADWRTRLAK